MVNHAMDKIRDEMAAKSSHAGVQAVGQFMTMVLQHRPETAGQVLAEGKTLEGAFGEIRKYAEGHKTGNYAFVPPDKADEIVRGYFGIGETEAEPQAPAAPCTPMKRAEPDDLDLDELLGGL